MRQSGRAMMARALRPRCGSFLQGYSFYTKSPAGARIDKFSDTCKVLARAEMGTAQNLLGLCCGSFLYIHNVSNGLETTQAIIQ